MGAAFISCSCALASPRKAPAPFGPLHLGPSLLIKARKERLSFIYGEMENQGQGAEPGTLYLGKEMLHSSEASTVLIPEDLSLAD